MSGRRVLDARRLFGPGVVALILLTACPQVVVVEDQDARPRDAGFRDGGIAGARDAGIVDAGRPDSGARDGGVDRDGGSDRDAGFVRDAGPDGCFVDPFAVCDDPEEAERRNDDWASASAFHTTSVGCLRGDEFTPFDLTRSSLVCQTDPADFYRLTVVPCDTRTLIAELRMRVLTACPADRSHLAFFSAGGRIDCSDSRLTCSTVDGEEIIQLRVPPGNSILSWQIAVESDFEDVAFDYELQIILR